jgi:hypothetical protein
MNSGSFIKNGMSILNNFDMNNMNKTKSINYDEDNKINNLPTFKNLIDKIPKDELNSLTKKNPQTKNKSDDYIFAMNEVKNIDNKIEKKKRDRLKIWEKGLNNNTVNSKINMIYIKIFLAVTLEQDPRSTHVRKRISEIKKLVKEKGGLDSTQLKNQNYFSKEHLDIIMESTRIIKEVKLHKNNQIEKGASLNSFITENREICLKNILLDLLKSERQKISNKDTVVSKALDECGVKLVNDWEEFKQFEEDQKKLQKEMERILFEMTRENRDLIDKKKRLGQECKQIQDEMERTIKMIVNSKYYANFVHSVLGGTMTQNLRTRTRFNTVAGSGSRCLDLIEMINKERDIDKVIEIVK